MTIDGDQPREAEQTEGVARSTRGAEPSESRDIWGWVQLVGLGLLAAGVVVLVAFALTYGGR